MNASQSEVMVKETAAANLPSRPRTRRAVSAEEEQRQREEAKKNEPRRSDRNHDVSDSLNPLYSRIKY